MAGVPVDGAVVTISPHDPRSHSHMAAPLVYIHDPAINPLFDPDSDTTTLNVSVWNSSSGGVAGNHGNTSAAISMEMGVLHWGVLGLSLLIVATALGNVLVCLAVCWDKRLQNMTNYFLMSLAIADLLVAILVMPLGLVVELYGFFPLTPGICVVWASTDVLMCTASIWHMCTMSMDRYFTLKYPMKYGRNKTKLMVALKITFVWVISMAICSPICIMGFLDYSNVYNDDQCAPAISNFLIYGSLFAFYVPLFIMVVTYTLTTRILCSNQRFMKGLISQQHNGKKPRLNGIALSTDNNNMYHSNGGVASCQQRPSGLRVETNTLDISLSERASVQVSEDYLDKQPASRIIESRKASKASCTSPTNSCHGYQASSTSASAGYHGYQAACTSPTSSSHDYQGSCTSPTAGYHGFQVCSKINQTQDTEKSINPAPQDSPISAKGFSCNGSTLNMALSLSDHFSGNLNLSVSQPHLPSMVSPSHHPPHKLLALSSSHHNLNTSHRGGGRDHLSVSHLESVQNFDSILSLNSMLSGHYGSEAWSDFDEPAMLEKISLIEAEMDDCLTAPNTESEGSQKQQQRPRFGLNSESDVDSPKSYMESPSLVISQSLQRFPSQKSAKVFLYPSSASQVFSCKSGQMDTACGSPTSINKLAPDVTHSPDLCMCTSPGIPRAESPAIVIQDTTSDSIHDCVQDSQDLNDSAFMGVEPLRRKPVDQPSSKLGIIGLNDFVPSPPTQNSGGEGRKLTLDLDTSILTTCPPVITTSPASTQSQHSVLSDPAVPGSPQQDFITIELRPKACYLYRVGKSSSHSEQLDLHSTRLNKETSNDRQTSESCTDIRCEKLQEHVLCPNQQLGIPLRSISQALSADSIPNHRPIQNAFSTSPSANHLVPGVLRSLSSSRSSSCRHLVSRYVTGASLADTELVSQEVERSTDDTLSEPVSCSTTTSASRLQLPSLAIHWSARRGTSIRTFLRQYSFRKGGRKYGTHGGHQIMSKRIASNEKKASKVLGIIFGVFFVLWTPFFLVNFVSAICVPCSKVITPPLMASLVWLGYLSSLANPIIYTMFNTSFRRAFYNILTCRLKRKSQRRHGRRKTNTVCFSNYTTSDRRSRSHRHISQDKL